MGELLKSAKENLLFVLVCVLIFAGLFAVAYLYERFAGKQRDISKTKYIAYIAMFSAVAGVLMFAEIPLFFAPSFYELDFSEIPIMICTFFLGPVSGVVAEFLKILIKLLFKGTSTAFVGDFANFVVGCSFVLPASMVYYKSKTKKGAVVAMILGTVTMTVLGSLFNAVYLLPKFSELFHLPMDAIIEMGTKVNKNITSVSTLVLFAVVPFNLLKGTLVSIVTFFAYKRISPILKK